MTDTILQMVLTLVACSAVAYAISKVIAELADRLHLPGMWTAEREAKRHGTPATFDHHVKEPGLGRYAWRAHA